MKANTQNSDKFADSSDEMSAPADILPYLRNSAAQQAQLDVSRGLTSGPVWREQIEKKIVTLNSKSTHMVRIQTFST